MSKPEIGEITRLLQDWSSGSRSALDELTPLVYNELHRIAAAYLRRERGDHTLQPTALIHETYLRLAGQSTVECRTRAHFFAIAANLMRQILVNYCNRRGAAKRGGGNRVALEDAAEVGRQRELDVLALDQALCKLAEIDARQSRIVELRFFGGLTESEVAEVLNLSPRTVKREWRTAKIVLYRELHGSDLP